MASGFMNASRCILFAIRTQSAEFSADGLKGTGEADERGGIAGDDGVRVVKRERGRRSGNHTSGAIGFRDGILICWFGPIQALNS